MTRNTVDPCERFESLDAICNQPDLDTAHDDPHVAYVLEAIEATDVLRDQPVAILCPDCGEVVDSYATGLPAYVCHFDASCATCEMDSLPRWSVVAVDARYVDVLPTRILRRVVQRYWNRHLWEGIETAEGCPRTREFSKLYDRFAKEWGWDWRVQCPLCRRTRAQLPNQKLDYHHWREDPDTGILICRECHDAIGGGKVDSDLDWQARELGLRSKHDLQIARLAAREALIRDYSSLDELALQVSERYNLVQSDTEVQCILDQTLNKPSLRSEIIDEYLLAGLDGRE